MVHLRKPSQFHITLHSPSGVLFSGDIKAVTLINELGPFDVLERHTNFISAIKEKISIYQEDDSVKEFPIEQGIVKINKTGVEIFLGIEPLPEIVASKKE